LVNFIFKADLKNIFDVFLPQLLTYPNPNDPLNGEAASLLLKEPEKYKTKIKDYIKKYATNTNVFEEKNEKSVEDEDTLSSVSIDSKDIEDFEFE
jgi:ubiquitin-conjugating enzyme E2 H